MGDGFRNRFLLKLKCLPISKLDTPAVSVGVCVCGLSLPRGLGPAHVFGTAAIRPLDSTDQLIGLFVCRVMIGLNCTPHSSTVQVYNTV
jgi:hypothetical protein